MGGGCRITEEEVSPITASYNDKIRPLLDAVDKLRHLQVMKEGIQLPTIVVVGDQSHGKSSVIESLAGIRLPSGKGMCTRVPLIIRLQNTACDDAQLFLEYNGKKVITDEALISEAIDNATDDIAGSGKGISNTPLTLHVKKNGVPDLTMVDLPGITRVPVGDQPANIQELISEIIMKHITPEESIILNVLGADVDFSTCECIRMSQDVDKSGCRTLAVVTKADKAPEGLLEKVKANDVKIGLGYVCVRNRIGEESFEQARKEEANLFSTHPLLSRIDRSMVGIPALALKLSHIQAVSMAKCLPDIVKQIDEKLSLNKSDLGKLPKNMTSVDEAVNAFLIIMDGFIGSLQKIFISGEFDEYPDNPQMHCTAKLAEMLEQFADHLNKHEEIGEKEFLMEEISLLLGAKAISLPNFLPRRLFLTALQRKVNGISSIPTEFVSKVWIYLETVVLTVLADISVGYPQLQYGLIKRASQRVMAKAKIKFIDRVEEMVEMEKSADYTCSPEYMDEWQNLLAQQDLFMRELFTNGNKPPITRLDGFGDVKIDHLRKHPHITQQVAQQAFDLHVRVSAYWKIVLKRLVDNMALLLLFNIQNLVNKELKAVLRSQLLAGPDGTIKIQQMLELSPLVAGKRDGLEKSIRLLEDANDIVENIKDRINMFTG